MKHKQIVAAFGLVACVLAFTACEKTDGSTRVGKHYAVDMGLSVRWATCNVGAKSPSDYGDHYAWGETKTKGSYSWDNYGSWTKVKDDYKSPADFFAGQSYNIAGTDADVAHREWGSTWRMPTQEEFVELADTNNCVWSKTKQGGVNGFLVKSRITKKSIFLPMAGCRYISDDYNEGRQGAYWSSVSNDEYAGCLVFNSTKVSQSENVVVLLNVHAVDKDYLFYGMTVRPVTK